MKLSIDNRNYDLSKNRITLIISKTHQRICENSNMENEMKRCCNYSKQINQTFESIVKAILESVSCSIVSFIA